MTRVYVLNGPNLGRLGTRQVDVYGLTTYQHLVELCEQTGRELGLDVVVKQTDAEHEMLGWLHAAADEQAAVVLNPGAWSSAAACSQPSISCSASVCRTVTSRPSPLPVLTHKSTRSWYEEAP